MSALSIYNVKRVRIAYGKLFNEKRYWVIAYALYVLARLILKILEFLLLLLLTSPPLCKAGVEMNYEIVV